MVSGQPWPGCQRALQAEQNSMSQALHCTSWGVCSPMSWSWHTAWQVDAGHHVRQGSKSTSRTRRKKAKIRFRTPWALERESMEERLWGLAQGRQNGRHVGDPARHPLDKLILYWPRVHPTPYKPLPAFYHCAWCAWGSFSCHLTLQFHYILQK